MRPSTWTSLPASTDDRSGRVRSVGTQVEMLKEMPSTVYTTPSGTCIHGNPGLQHLEQIYKVHRQGGVCKVHSGSEGGHETSVSGTRLSPKPRRGVDIRDLPFLL